MLRGRFDFWSILATRRHAWISLSTMNSFGFFHTMALKDIKVIELPGTGPGPFCGTILADFGANVTIVQKIKPSYSLMGNMCNGKRTISLDLRRKEGVTVLKKLCSQADVLIDSFRPGLLESMGLGPNVLLEENPRLIYARLSGYGQESYLRDKGGHDINFTAMSGVLSTMRTKDQPPFPPAMLISNFAGGSILCALGIMIALHERTKSGKGQVVDASMAQGLAYVATWLYRSKNMPLWAGNPGTNVLDGGFPYYNTYKTKDNKFMAVAAVEPKLYSELLNALQLSKDEYRQSDIEKTTKKFEEVFLQKTQEEWCEIFDKIDACVTPVLELDSIAEQKYYSDGKAFLRDENNIIIPQPSPKLSVTPGDSVWKKPLPHHGQHTVEILLELGYSKKAIDELVQMGCVNAYQKSNL